MNKGNTAAVCTWARLLVNQADALCFQFFQFSSQIVTAVSNVVYSLAAFFKKTADRAVIGSGLQ